MKTSDPMGIEQIIDAGFVPFIATSDYLLPFINQRPFGIDPMIIVNNEENLPFHQAYLAANSLAFGSPEESLGMPGWVYTDLVISQTAVVGFAAKVADCCRDYLENLQACVRFDFSQLEYIPIAAQIAGRTADPDTWFGFSLISHQRNYRLACQTELSLASYAKALALVVYGSRNFMGLTQYTNSAIRHHAQFGRMFIHQPVVWTHSKPNESFVYEMAIDFDPNDFYRLPDLANAEFDFILNSNDQTKKRELAKGIKLGNQYEIVSPYQILESDGSCSLPVKTTKRQGKEKS